MFKALDLVPSTTKRKGEEEENSMYISYDSHFYGQTPDNSKVKEEVFISVYSLRGCNTLWQGR